MVCRKLSKTTRVGCVLLKTVEAGNNFRNVERDVPACLGDPSASGMTGTNAVVAWLTERRIVRERFGEHLLPPLSVSNQL